jgi:lipoyl(octanoyl) transferase
MIIKKLGLTNYNDVWQKMYDFTIARMPETPDELWVLQHFPVFTQGQAGRPEHVLNPRDIPVVQTDRGGQVTYHGPGQIVAYPLIDLKRLKMGVREFVTRLENATIKTLAEYDIVAFGKPDAPGVYVGSKKICSIGLKVKRGCTYHGIAFNVDMDLEPFSRINPCGFNNLKMTQVKDYVPDVKISDVEEKLAKHLEQELYA